MKKILIEVHVPVTNETYELLVPAEMTIDTVTNLLQKYLSSEVHSVFTTQENTCLHDMDSGEILNKNKTIEDLGLYTGKKLFYV